MELRAVFQATRAVVPTVAHSRNVLPISHSATLAHGKLVHALHSISLHVLVMAMAEVLNAPSRPFIKRKSPVFCSLSLTMIRLNEWNGGCMSLSSFTITLITLACRHNFQLDSTIHVHNILVHISFEFILISFPVPVFRLPKLFYASFVWLICGFKFTPLCVFLRLNLMVSHKISCVYA
jgi:hypothetical protein